jgi:multiple sugar transport system substrate-binding protein
MQTFHQSTADPPGSGGPIRSGPSRRGLLTGAAALVAGAATTSLSGCAASVRGIGKTVLQIAAQSSDISDDIIADFQRQNPDIRISLVAPEWDVIVSMLAADAPPDLARGTGVTDTPYLVARDLAEPIDDYLAGSSVLKRSDLATVNGVWRYDGHTQGKGPYYGLCKDYSCDLTLWVNEDHLAKAGIPLPSTEKPLTYDQVLAISKKANQVSHGRNTVLGFGAVFGGKPDFAWLQGMMATAGASPFSDDFTEVDLTVPAGVEAINWFMEIVGSRTTQSFLAPQAINDTGLYVAGRMAVLQSGYWTTGLVDTASAEVRKASYLLPAPQLGDHRVSPTTSGTGWWMAKKSANKEAAWRFMEYFFGGKPAVDRAKTGWGTPSLKSNFKYLPTDQPFQRRSLQTQLAENRYLSVLPFTPYVQLSALGLALTTAFEQGFRAHKSAHYIAAAATKAMNAALSQGKRKV